MDGTPQFLTDVKFAERRKGYDPEQVDNYLSQISERVAQLQDMVRDATARADDAEKKIADAQRAQGVAEAQVDKLKADVERLEGAGPRPIDEASEVEHASKVLLMAQKTADATVEEANATAHTTVADAQREAASMLAEAEREAANLRFEAKRQIDDLVQQRRTEVLAEVTSLEKVRDDVAADVSALERHLETQRANLRSGVEALQRLLDDPDSLRAAPAPQLSEATLAEITRDDSALADPDPGTDLDADTDADVAVVEVDMVEVVEVVDAEQAVDDAEATSDTDSAEPVGEADADTATDDGAVGAHRSDEPEPADEVLIDVEPEPVVIVIDDDQSPGDTHEVNAGFAHDPEDEFPPVKLPELLSDVQPAGQSGDIDLTTERLFESHENDADRNGGPPTEFFTPFADDADKDDPLGQPDADADAAMRAFFEADFESENEPKKSRWRR